MRLGRPDIEAILGFLGDVDGLDGDESYPAELLGLLQGLVPSDDVSYQEADLEGRRFIEIVPGEADEDDELYWTVGPCPIADYRSRTGDLSAVRMSDVIGRQRYHELPFYREYFLPVGLDHVLDLGLSAGRNRYRSLVLLRDRASGDYSDRDRDILEALRPHLRAREARAELRRRLRDPRLASGGDDAPDPFIALTLREREILLLVAAGKTNVQIAAELWVAPSTVKKHLEHVYEKLGVGRRAAAAGRLQAVN
jgi:DNA-binding CsgD family transcriptional regulator